MRICPSHQYGDLRYVVEFAFKESASSSPASVAALEWKEADKGSDSRAPSTSRTLPFPFPFVGCPWSSTAPYDPAWPWPACVRFSAALARLRIDARSLCSLVWAYRWTLSARAISTLPTMAVTMPMSDDHSCSFSPGSGVSVGDGIELVEAAAAISDMLPDTVRDGVDAPKLAASRGTMARWRAI